MGSSLCIAVYPDAAIDRTTDQQLRQSVDHISPDALIVGKPHHEAQFRGCGITTHVIVLDTLDGVTINASADPQLVALGKADDFETYSSIEHSDSAIDTSAETFLLTTKLSVDIDLTTLTTELEGKPDYDAAMDNADLTGSYTHLTPHAPPEYEHTWGGLSIHGIRPGADETEVSDTTEIAMLNLYPDGTVAAKTLDATSFGLQGLTGVGPTTASTLRSAHLTTVDDVAQTPPQRLQDLEGIGEKTSEKIRYSAKSLVNGCVYRTSDESLPSGEPVFIDIETDGLTPTMVWLIGVLDPVNDQYMSFLATDPENKAKAVRGFMMWFTANAENRPVVAYNGQTFDFPVLHDQIHQQCPEYLDDWKEAWTFDPYWWAVKQNNAILPGRSNDLETVAEALGWETDETGLTGAVVGQRFQRWLANPCEDTALDWAANEEYCEDDVRSLAHVYRAIEDAATIGSVTRTMGETNQSEQSTDQGTLSDF